MIGKIKKIYHDYPSQFWVLVFATFVDTMGGWLIFPFFALYITRKFQVGMTEVGILLAIYSISGALGSMIGGALADKFGRKSISIFGLVFSALSNVLMGVATQLWWFYILALSVGLLSSFGGPARQAMVTDILPEEKRAEGFSIFRIIFNISATVGPIAGGLLASRSYLLLFIADAIASVITALIVYVKLDETKPQLSAEQAKKSIWTTLVENKLALSDKVFVGLILPVGLMWAIYTQMMSTLSVYLRDYRGIPEQGYGALISINAIIVILFQFWITRKLRDKHPLLILVAGTAFLLVGFSMYAFVSGYSFFVLAMVIITIGEMVNTPTEQSFVSQIAPKEMRGRYMAVRGLVMMLFGTSSRLGAGLIMDYLNPEWVWIATGILAAIAIALFYNMYLRMGQQLSDRIAQGSQIQPAPAGD